MPVNNNRRLLPLAACVCKKQAALACRVEKHSLYAREASACSASDACCVVSFAVLCGALPQAQKASYADGEAGDFGKMAGLSPASLSLSCVSPCLCWSCVTVDVGLPLCLFLCVCVCLRSRVV
jgi:hypothetical protein